MSSFWSQLNIILCLGVIRKGTESEKKYKITWDDCRAAAVLMTGYKDCGKQGCDCCEQVMHLLGIVVGNAAVKGYLRSREFREKKVPVETTMCDNIKRWGNFAINELGIVGNVCLQHGTGKVNCSMAAIAADNYSHLQYFGGRRGAYDDYYEIVVYISVVTIPEFATRVHTSKRNVDIMYRDMMEQVMESGSSRAPLRLKMRAYHHDLIAEGEALPLEILDLKTVLMPRQRFLNKLDPDGSLTIPQLRNDFGAPHARVQGRRLKR